MLTTHTLTHVLDLYARTQIIDVLIHGGHKRWAAR
nr:Uncharacterised protein [Raoultella sp. NCTC 9187]